MLIAFERNYQSHYFTLRLIGKAKFERISKMDFIFSVTQRLIVISQKKSFEIFKGNEILKTHLTLTLCARKLLRMDLWYSVGQMHICTYAHTQEMHQAKMIDLDNFSFKLLAFIVIYK